MPGGDGTGPWWAQGGDRGWWPRRRFYCRRFWLSQLYSGYAPAPAPLEPIRAGDEKQYLEQEKAYLESELKAIEARIKELK